MISRYMIVYTAARGITNLEHLRAQNGTRYKAMVWRSLIFWGFFSNSPAACLNSENGLATLQNSNSEVEKIQCNWDYKVRNDLNSIENYWLFCLVFTMGGFPYLECCICWYNASYFSMKMKNCDLFLYSKLFKNHQKLHRSQILNPNKKNKRTDFCPLSNIANIWTSSP